MMSDKECDQLAQGWIRHKRGSPADRPAWGDLAVLTARDPESAWRVTLRLIDLARDTELLGGVGAGPLEELISESPALFVDRVEQLAATDSAFKTALSYVWLSDAASDVSKRLIALGCTTVSAEDRALFDLPKR